MRIRQKINQTKKVKNHDFTHISDKKLKAKNEQRRKTNKQTETHRHKITAWLLPEGRCGIVVGSKKGQI